MKTTGTDDTVSFDLDGDGSAEQLTWTDSRTMEGFLWVNLAGKNRVDNGSELFGIGTVLPDGTKARDGFQALAMYDTGAYGGNGDGIIDASDAVWNELRVWVDSDHSGTCDPGEVRPLHRYGIQGISLAAASTTFVDENGNGHFLKGYYWRSSHGRLEILDVDGITFRGKRR